MHQNIRDDIQNYNRCPKENLEKTKGSQRWPLLISSVCDILRKPCTPNILVCLLFYLFYERFSLNMFIWKDSKKKKKK